MTTFDQPLAGHDSDLPDGTLYPSMFTATEPVRIPHSVTATSLLGLGPIPFTKVVSTHAMVAEAGRAPDLRDGDLSFAESAVRSRVIGRAQRRLDGRVSGPIEKGIAQVKPIHARINVLDQQLDNLDDLPILGAHGETLPVEQAGERHEAVRQQVERESADGSKRHLLRSHGSKWKEIAALALDFPVFLLAMFGLLNVNLRLVGPDLKTNILAVTAVVFALLGTVLFATTMRTMGLRHRRFKGHDSGIEAEGRVRRRIVVEIVSMLLIAGGAAGVMAARIALDGREADAPRFLTIALAVLFGTLIAVSGYINYMAEYENGSSETDALQHLGAQLQNRQKIRVDWEGARRLAIEEAGVRIAALNREVAKAKGDALRAVTTSSSDKAITVSRSFHGRSGSSAGLPSPDLDFTRLHLAEEQAHDLTSHQASLEADTNQKEE